MKLIWISDIGLDKLTKKQLIAEYKYMRDRYYRVYGKRRI